MGTSIGRRTAIFLVALGSTAACAATSDRTDDSVRTQSPEAPPTVESEPTESLSHIELAPRPTTPAAPVQPIGPTCSMSVGTSLREHAGSQRAALFVPARGAGPRPLLVLFHGFGGDPGGFAANTGLLAEARLAGVSLLVPAGSGEPATWEAQPGAWDDVGFVNALLTEVLADPCIDADQVWLAGYSAGAGFVGTFACDTEHRLAGIVMNAAVAPALCDVDGFDVIAAHGKADVVVPYDGLDIGSTGEPIVLPPTPDLMAGWAYLLGCVDGPVEIASDDSTQRRWTGCPGNGTVDLLTFDNGGHRWPGRPDVGGAGLVAESPDLTCVVLAAIAGDADPVAGC